MRTKASSKPNSRIVLCPHPSLLLNNQSFSVEESPVKRLEEFGGETEKAGIMRNCKIQKTQSRKRKKKDALP